MKPHLLLASAVLGMAASSVPVIAGSQAREKAAPQKKVEKRFTFEAPSLPWPKVFEWLTDQTGMPVVMAQKVPAGALSVVGPYSLAQVVDLINNALAAHKLILLRREAEFTLVGSSQIDPQLVPRIEMIDLQHRGSTEVVSLTVQLRTSAEALDADIHKLLGPSGRTVMLRAANQVVVQDRVANIKRILKLIRDVEDNDQGAADTGFEVMRLRNASAVQVAKILDEAFNGKPAWSGQGGKGGQGGFGAGRPTREPNERVRVVADPATNSLLIKAGRMDTFMIRKLLDESLDRADLDGEAVSRPWIIGPLRFAQATDVAGVIRDVYRDSMSGNPQAGKAATLSLGVDKRSNSLVLACSKPIYDDIKRLVAELDTAAKDASSADAPRRIQVLGLKNARAADVVKILRELYQVDRKAGFSADPRTNSLVVRCPLAMEAEIKALVQELDAKATPK